MHGPKSVRERNGLTYLRPDFLHAAYFCSARDSRWTSPHTFAESLAFQLAGRFPAYAQALEAMREDQQIVIKVDQRVRSVKGGQVVGVVIEKLDVSAVPPESAFNRIVREPLEAVFRNGFLKTKNQAIEPIVLESATREHLLKSIANTDIFHFAGHGVFEGSELTPEGALRKRGKILLETEEATEDRFDSDQLALTLGNAGVRLVVLGACNTAMRDEGGVWTGVAPALVRENIAAVVAMQYKVQDRNASIFMAFLYARVLAGSTIDEAVFEGRQAIFTQKGLEDWDWGVPVLYLRAEDGILFPLPSKNQDAPAQEGPLVLVQREIGTILGSDIGVNIDQVLGGRVEVRDTITIVEKGGRTTAVRIKQLGGTPSHAPRQGAPKKRKSGGNE